MGERRAIERLKGGDARVLVDHKGEKLLVAEGRVEAHTAHGDEIIDPTGRAGAGQGR